MSIKAIIAGIIFTIIILICGQLAYVLLASYIGTATSDYAFIKENVNALWFSLSALTFAICFILGGGVTAILTEHKKLIHAAIVGFVVSISSVLLTANLSDVGYKAAILVILGMVFAALGGLIIKRYDAADELP